MILRHDLLRLNDWTLHKHNKASRAFTALHPLCWIVEGQSFIKDIVMVMSQGTYTFLACFAGFWLVWALIVMVCCFCSFVQRKLKRRREERLREQCLRALEMEPLECSAAVYPARETLQFCPPPQIMSPPVPVTHTIPQGTWTTPQGRDHLHSSCIPYILVL